MATIKRLKGAISAKIKAWLKKRQLKEDPYQDPENWGSC